MSGDLVKRLRDMATRRNALAQDWSREMMDAADRIEALESQLAEADAEYLEAHKINEYGK